MNQLETLESYIGLREKIEMVNDGFDFDNMAENSAMERISELKKMTPTFEILEEIDCLDMSGVPSDWDNMNYFSENDGLLMKHFNLELK